MRLMPRALRLLCMRKVRMRSCCSMPENEEARCRCQWSIISYTVAAGMGWGTRAVDAGGDARGDSAVWQTMNSKCVMRLQCTALICFCFFLFWGHCVAQASLLCQGASCMQARRGLPGTAAGLAYHACDADLRLESRQCRKMATHSHTQQQSLGLWASKHFKPPCLHCRSTRGLLIGSCTSRVVRQVQCKMCIGHISLLIVKGERLVTTFTYTV